MKEIPFRTCTIEAPCKINLHLKIGEKRPDGFHSLESLFACLAFADTLRLSGNGNEGECGLTMDWECPEEPISPENNLVFRAVSLFREKTGYKKGLNIHLNKRIPLGAGLGGGSSDAAACLLALNFLADSPLSMEELSKIASFLGSDVPFFLSGGLAFVSGRGELVEPVPFSQKIWVVLVRPPFPSDTARAYMLLDQARKGNKYVMERKELPKDVLLRALEGNPASWPFYNDFYPGPNSLKNGDNEPSAVVYRVILEALQKEGALFSGLSGSGSCCFGIFSIKETAEKAARELSAKLHFPAPGEGKRPPHKTNFVRITFFLARRADPVLE